MKKWLAVLVLVSISMAPAFVFAQQAAPSSTPPAHEHAAGAPTEGKKDPAMMEKCKAEHEKRMADMKAMDTRLDEKLAAMNSAKGNQKVEAMAAVINELVSQRKEMREKFQTMRHGCMQMHGNEGGMGCPMMKSHEGMPMETPKKEGGHH